MKEKDKIKKTKPRGRPKKTFTSRKVEVKRDGPGRPRKDEKTILPEIPEKKENKIKDAIIILFFIISFIIFCFALYVNQKEKIDNILGLTKIEATTENNIIKNNTSDLELIKEEDNIKEEIKILDPKEIIIKEIYSNLNNKQFDEIYKHINISLKQGSIFRMYFSKNRLLRFMNNINGSIEIDEIEVNEETLNYKLSYNINNQKFEENREVVFSENQDEIKISSIMCTTTGCSTMPFFNPGKYF